MARDPKLTHLSKPIHNTGVYFFLKGNPAYGSRTHPWLATNQPIPNLGKGSKWTEPNLRHTYIITSTATPKPGPTRPLLPHIHRNKTISYTHSQGENKFTSTLDKRQSHPGRYEYWKKK